MSLTLSLTSYYCLMIKKFSLLPFGCVQKNANKWPNYQPSMVTRFPYRHQHYQRYHSWLAVILGILWCFKYHMFTSGYLKPTLTKFFHDVVEGMVQVMRFGSVLGKRAPWRVCINVSTKSTALMNRTQEAASSDLCQFNRTSFQVQHSQQCPVLVCSSCCLSTKYLNWKNTGRPHKWWQSGTRIQRVHWL